MPLTIDYDPVADVTTAARDGFAVYRAPGRRTDQEVLAALEASKNLPDHVGGIDALLDVTPEASNIALGWMIQNGTAFGRAGSGIEEAFRRQVFRRLATGPAFLGLVPVAQPRAVTGALIRWAEALDRYRDDGAWGVRLDAVDDHIRSDAAANALDDLTTAATWEVWCQIDNVVPQTGFLRKRDAGNVQGWVMRINAGELFCRVNLVGAVNVNMTTSGAALVNGRHHIAFVYEDPDLRFYIDGRLVGTATGPGGAISPATGDQFRVGWGDPPNGIAFFDGVIEQVAVHATARYRSSDFLPPRDLPLGLDSLLYWRLLPQRSATAVYDETDSRVAGSLLGTGGLDVYERVSAPLAGSWEVVYDWDAVNLRPNTLGWRRPGEVFAPADLLGLPGLRDDTWTAANPAAECQAHVRLTRAHLPEEDVTEGLQLDAIWSPDWLGRVGTLYGSPRKGAPVLRLDGRGWGTVRKQVYLLPYSPGMVLQGWFRLDELPAAGDATLFAQDATRIRVLSTGAIGYALDLAGAGLVTGTSAASLVRAGRWHHVQLGWTVAGTAATLRLDGAEVASGVHAGATGWNESWCDPRFGAPAPGTTSALVSGLMTDWELKAQAPSAAPFVPDPSHVPPEPETLNLWLVHPWRADIGSRGWPMQLEGSAEFGELRFDVNSDSPEEPYEFRPRSVVGERDWEYRRRILDEATERRATRFAVRNVVERLTGVRAGEYPRTEEGLVWFLPGPAPGPPDMTSGEAASDWDGLRPVPAAGGGTDSGVLLRGRGGAADYPATVAVEHHRRTVVAADAVMRIARQFSLDFSLVADDVTAGTITSYGTPGAATARGLDVRFVGAGDLQVRVADGGQAVAAVCRTFGSPVTASVRHQVRVVWTGLWVLIFVDGVLRGSAPARGPGLVHPIAPNLAFAVGADVSGGGGAFNGRIDYFAGSLLQRPWSHGPPPFWPRPVEASDFCWFDFDTVNPTLPDQSGRGFDLTATGGAGPTAVDYTTGVRVASAASLDLAGDFTVEAWTSQGRAVECEPTENYVGLVAARQSGMGRTTGWVLGFLDGRAVFRAAFAGGNVLLRSRLLLGIGLAPHHLAATLAGNVLSLWVDGRLAAQATKSGAMAAPAGLDLVLGVRDDGLGVAGRSANAGLADEFALHSTSRYAADFTPPDHFVADASTRVLLRLDGDYLDASGNGNNGVPFGEPAFAPTPRIAATQAGASRGRGASVATDDIRSFAYRIPLPDEVRLREDVLVAELDEEFQPTGRVPVLVGD